MFGRGKKSKKDAAPAVAVISRRKALEIAGVYFSRDSDDDSVRGTVRIKQKYSPVEIAQAYVVCGKYEAYNFAHILDEFSYVQEDLPEIINIAKHIIMQAHNEVKDGGSTLDIDRQGVLKKLKEAIINLAAKTKDMNLTLYYSRVIEFIATEEDLDKRVCESVLTKIAEDPSIKEVLVSAVRPLVDQNKPKLLKRFLSYITCKEALGGSLQILLKIAKAVGAEECIEEIESHIATKPKKHVSAVQLAPDASSHVSIEDCLSVAANLCEEDNPNYEKFFQIVPADGGPFIWVSIAKVAVEKRRPQFLAAVFERLDSSDIPFFLIKQVKSEFYKDAIALSVSIGLREAFDLLLKKAVEENESSYFNAILLGVSEAESEDKSSYLKQLRESLPEGHSLKGTIARRLGKTLPGRGSVLDLFEQPSVLPTAREVDASTQPPIKTEKWDKPLVLGGTSPSGFQYDPALSPEENVAKSRKMMRRPGIHYLMLLGRGDDYGGLLDQFLFRCFGMVLSEKQFALTCTALTGAALSTFMHVLGDDVSATFAATLFSLLFAGMCCFMSKPSASKISYSTVVLPDEVKFTTKERGDGGVAYAYADPNGREIKGFADEVTTESAYRARFGPSR